MIHVIVAPEYEFFTSQKNTLKKKLSLGEEYAVEDILVVPSVHADFSSEGFFDRPSYLLVYKYLFSEIIENDYVQYLTDLINTKHTVLLYEKELSKELAGFLKEQGIVPIEMQVQPSGKPPTPFAFTDAVIARDKKTAWIEFMKLRNNHTEMINITSSLIWAIKSVLLVLVEKDVGSTGLNPYVYTKITKNKKLWSVSDAHVFLRTLLYLSLEEQFDEEAQSVRLEQLLFSL